MFCFNKTNISQVFEIDLPIHNDNRGAFSKVFQKSLWESEEIAFNLKESYYSRSAQNVIRGMHFQLPPFQHHKIVYCPEGSILDVALDLRTHSPTYGSFFSAVLSSENNKAIFIPEGCAHGFKSLSDNTLTVYLVSSEYNQEADAGILWSSFNFDWNCANPIISSRDAQFQSFHMFKSPF